MKRSHYRIGGAIKVTQKNILENAASNDKIFFEESRHWKIAADAIDFIDPNIDGTVGCAVASPNSNHYQNVNDALRQPDTTNATSSYNACLENQTDFFGFTNLTNISTVSAIEAWVYHQDGNENMQWEIYFIVKSGYYLKWQSNKIYVGLFGK